MSPDNAKQLHQQAQQLFQQGKYAESLAVLSKLGQEFPNEPNIMYARARCLVALGRFDEARPICASLKDIFGHPRGAELLQQIDARMATTAQQFDILDSKPRQVPPAARLQRSGPSKLVYIGAAAAAAVAIAGVGYFLYNGRSQEATVAEAAREIAARPAPDNPTYHKDIAPIFNANCVVCHRPGEAVPMVLTSYEQARPWAKSIRNMVETRAMPPWHADPLVGKFANDRRLSDRDVTTILRWVDQGTPRGNPEEGPEPLTFTAGWKIGEPDVVFTAPTQSLPAELEDEYRYVFVPTGFSKDRWIQAAEIRPGNVDVVHHVIVFTADPSKGRNGLEGSLGGFAPGSPPLIMEHGRGMKISAGEILVLQIHYHKEPGAVETDQTTIGLKFAEETVKKELRFGTVGTERFAIPPHTSYYPVEARLVLDEDIHLEQIVPHMHLRGTDMKVSAKYPDGRREDILFVPKYDFNWQTFYELAEPKPLPKGTELMAYAHYDNSKSNPFNPDPSAEVRFGEPTTAEMMYAFFMYTVDNEKLKVKDPGD